MSDPHLAEESIRTAKTVILNYHGEMEPGKLKAHDDFSSKSSGYMTNRCLGYGLALLRIMRPLQRKP